MSAGGGGTSGGALAQIVTKGVADTPLNGNASVTFWRLRTASHTNFALEQITQAFNSSVAFGSTSNITINRTGDMIYRQYVVADLPGIAADVMSGQTSSTYPWVLDEAAACATSGHGYLPLDQATAGSSPLCGHYVCWVQAVGLALIKRVKLVVG